MLVAVACGIVVMAALVVAARGAPGGPAVAPGRPPCPLPPVPTHPRASIARPRRRASSGTESELAPSDPSPFLIALVQIVARARRRHRAGGARSAILLALWRRPRITLHEDPSFDDPRRARGAAALGRAADRRCCAPARRATPSSPPGSTSRPSVAATGLPRDPAETSTEFTERVIGTWDVDRLRLGDLAALYREARFSVHELDEAHRDRAITTSSPAPDLEDRSRRCGPRRRVAAVGGRT